MVDAREGLHPIDQHIADIVRKNDKNKILLINKAEGMQTEIVSAEFYSFGFKQILPISSAHGEGISFLKEMIINFDWQEEPSEIKKNIPKITIIGRPNVGKSTLTNALLGEERFIVYDEAGTTRDAVSAEFVFNKKEFILTDTAGIRKKGKVIATIEKFSIIKTLSSIESSNVCLLYTSPSPRDLSTSRMPSSA